METLKEQAAILFIILFTGTASGQPVTDSIDYYILHRSYERAAVLCKRQLTELPDDHGLLMNYGIAMQALQEYDIALKSYTAALDQDKTGYAAAYRMAECYEALGDKEEAIKTYSDILEADSCNLYSMQQKARLLLSLKDYEQARDYYTTLLKHSPGNYLFNKNIGICQYRLLNESKAAFHFIQAWGANKRDLSLPVNIANAYNKLKLPVNALFYLSQGLEYDSLNIPILKTAGSIKYAMSNFEDAAEYLNKAYQQGDTSLFTSKYLGLSFFKLSRFEESIPHLRTFYSLDTLNTEATYYLGLALSSWHMKDEGIAWLQKTIDLSYPNPAFIASIYAAMASAAADKNERSKAIEYYAKAIELDPHTPGYYLETGKLYDAKAGIDNSADLYRRAIEYYDLYLKAEQPRIEIIMSQRGLREDQISAPGMDYAKRRIKKIREELFFRGELEKRL